MFGMSDSPETDEVNVFGVDTLNDSSANPSRLIGCELFTSCIGKRNKQCHIDMYTKFLDITIR